jgi:hypothetical protein
MSITASTLDSRAFATFQFIFTVEGSGIQGKQQVKNTKINICAVQGLGVKYIVGATLRLIYVQVNSSSWFKNSIIGSLNYVLLCIITVYIYILERLGAT